MLIVFCDFLHKLTQDMFVIVDDFADHKLNIANLKNHSVHRVECFKLATGYIVRLKTGCEQHCIAMSINRLPPKS